MFDSYTCRHNYAAHLIRKTIFLLLILLMPAALLQAQHDNRSHYQLLWRINGPGLSSPSYLFGTMHLTENRVFEFSDSVLMALRSSASFAMEVDLDSVMAYMLSPGGPLLDTVNHMRRLLTADEYHYVDSLVIQKTGAPLEHLKLKRMWFVEKLLLDEEGELSKNAAPDQKGENIFLDGWLHQKATGLHKPVHSLERLQNQLHIMSADVSEMQKEVFLWTLGYHEAGNGDAKEKTDRFNTRVNYLDSLVNMYYKADLEKIAKFVNSAEAENIDEGPGLVVRNIEMADNLSLLVNKGGVFAAVGVAHLPGEKGILSLLRAKGYTVTPVNATFTGAAKRDRQSLDSMKGYALNKIADGYSVMLPGIPIAYPIPNMNRKMYIGNNNDNVGFAFCIDIPQLGTDKKELVNMMIANMAKQGNAKLQKSYPINYRTISGTEAILLQENVLLYIRLFIRNNRAFVFMYNGADADSSSRKEFFKSVRFYDISRPVTLYDTVSRPQLGFTAILPSDVNNIKSGNIKDGIRPVEAYSGLDDANSISYILRIEKMQRGYYNINDKTVLEGVRAMILLEDSTLQLIDSTLTERDGLPLYQFVYRHNNGFISRLNFIPRGNLSYFLLCQYDGARTDSSYWQRFLSSFHILPLKAQAPTVPFIAEDSSFTISGPEYFTGGIMGKYKESSRVNVYLYKAMDSTSHTMYVVEVDKYGRYYHNQPDSLLKEYVNSDDSTFIIINRKKSVWEGLPVYETEMKGRYTGLHWYRRAIVAGHTIYRLSAILPEEVTNTGYGQQFLASFHPGTREKADTFRLQQNKLSLLLKDLQSADTTVFNRANDYLDNLKIDRTDKGLIMDALMKPFPADTGTTSAKMQLMLTLEDFADDSVVHVAEKLFAATTNIWNKQSILRFINGIVSDSAVHTFLRLAPEMPEYSDPNGNIFAYSFDGDSLYQKYLPAIITLAEKSPAFLQSFMSYTERDSIWLAPQFSQYGLERLLPGMMQQFDYQLKKWKDRQPDEDDDWKMLHGVMSVSRILALPGMPASAATGFRQLLTDTTVILRIFGARGLMNRGIHVDDKILSSILADNDVAYTFIQAVKDDKQIAQIRHLLTQELLGRSYVTYYMSEDYTITDIEPVTRVKVQLGKEPAQVLILYRYKTDESEDWEYLLNGPHPLLPATLNFEPHMIHDIEEKSIVTDKKKLAAEATEAYKKYLADDEPEE